MAHLAHKQDAEHIRICRRLFNEAENARLKIGDWRGQTERLIDKIDLEESLLDDLRRQRQRTGDDAFDADIEKQLENIENLREKVKRARINVHRWEGEADIIERQIIANDCGNFA